MPKINKLILDGKSVAMMYIDGKKCFPLNDSLDEKPRGLKVVMTTLEDIPGSYTYRLDLTYNGPEVDITEDLLYPQMMGEGTYQIQKDSNYAVVVTVINPSSTDVLEFIVAVKLPAGDGYASDSYIEMDEQNEEYAGVAVFSVQPAASV
ncbi:MAG: hypothetical protein IJZ15_04315 [Oscillospiraceae bacterium]|nr:hypothetical protein [Oscillospiraceae bacterium]